MAMIQKIIHTRWVNLLVCICFVMTSIPAVQAAVLPYMPEPNQRIMAGPAYDLPLLEGIVFSADSPFYFTFLIKRGNVEREESVIRSEVNKISKYFLAALTLPGDDLWVNLSPYEQDRISTDNLALTDLGKDMLGEDYVLKQFVASITYPEEGPGKAFWSAVYKQLQEKLGTSNVPVDTFNKVWIMPDKIKIVEGNDRAVIESARLKVMMEDDYLAISKNKEKSSSIDAGADRRIKDISNQVMREQILPLIEKEVNEGKYFAHLRQIYHSIIMANWFKEKLKNTILNQVYFDKSKLKGADVKDPAVREKIYNAYTQAFREGVYNYIKTDQDPGNQFKRIRRKYVSGGANLTTGPMGKATERITDPVRAVADSRAANITAAEVARVVNTDGKLIQPPAPGSAGKVFAEPEVVESRISGLAPNGSKGLIKGAARELVNMVTSGVDPVQIGKRMHTAYPSLFARGMGDAAIVALVITPQTAAQAASNTDGVIAQDAGKVLNMYIAQLDAIKAQHAGQEFASRRQRRSIDEWDLSDQSIAGAEYRSIIGKVQHPYTGEYNYQEMLRLADRSQNNDVKRALYRIILQNVGKRFGDINEVSISLAIRVLKALSPIMTDEDLQHYTELIGTEARINYLRDMLRDMLQDDLYKTTRSGSDFWSLMRDPAGQRVLYSGLERVILNQKQARGGTPRFRADFRKLSDDPRVQMTAERFFNSLPADFGMGGGSGTMAGAGQAREAGVGGGAEGDGTKGGLDFAKSNAEVALKDGGLKFSTDKAMAYLENGKVAGLELATLKLTY